MANNLTASGSANTVYGSANTATGSISVTTGPTTVSTHTITGVCPNMDMYMTLHNKQKILKLDKNTFLYITNIGNKGILISQLLIDYKIDKTRIYLDIHTGGNILFSTIDETKKYINKVRKFYKKAIAFKRELEMDSDFM